jgi:hypothetical protein
MEKKLSQSEQHITAYLKKIHRIAFSVEANTLEYGHTDSGISFIQIITNGDGIELVTYYSIQPKTIGFSLEDVNNLHSTTWQLSFNQFESILGLMKDLQVIE